MKMDKNEIKKALYKQNPKAVFNYIRKGVAYYKTIINTESIEDGTPTTIGVDFEIPISDMGDADFFSEMDSKLLNRYIVVQ